MNYLEIALLNASKGYPIFPCQIDKRPKAKLTDWEAVATTDESQIRAWWSEDPTFLPAVPPGRVGKAVVDVDRHVGKDDGFASLDEHGVVLPKTFYGISISGNGTHYWHHHAVGSVNGIYPGVDRKAQGGYVVVPYELPEVDSITAPLPEELTGGIKASNVERKQLSNSQLNEWIREAGDGMPDDEMWKVIEAFKPNGNEQMSRLIARAVALASDGHSGGSYALDKMLEKWTSGTHYSGDPEEEFQANVRSAIEKFGEIPQDTTLDDKFRSLLNPVVTVNTNDLAEMLAVFCGRIQSDWREHAYVMQRYQDCIYLIQMLQSVEDVNNWIVKTKEIMRKVLDNG